MDRTRNTADRVRPFLQAMEQSIDAARRKRTAQNDTPAPAEGGLTPSAPVQNPTTENSATIGHDESTPRLKARPKRDSSVILPNPDSGLHSRAG